MFDELLSQDIQFLLLLIHCIIRGFALNLRSCSISVWRNKHLKATCNNIARQLFFLANLCDFNVVEHVFLPFFIFLNFIFISYLRDHQKEMFDSGLTSGIFTGGWFLLPFHVAFNKSIK